MKKLLLLSLLVSSLSYAQVYDQNGVKAKGMNEEPLEGFIGIGIDHPQVELDVKGNIRYSDQLMISNDAGLLWKNNDYLTELLSIKAKGLSLKSSEGPILFSTEGNTERMRVLENGKVGIGTTTFETDDKLAVNGKIRCEEVEVIANVLPDFVFEKYYTGESTLKADYIMPTLEEVETYIKANHHLPEVPSAAKVKEDGLQLKEMTTLLLQKIEELTLYTIEQEKRIIALEDKLAEKE